MIALWALAALALGLKIKGEPEANDRAAGFVEAERAGQRGVSGSVFQFIKCGKATRCPR